jgi:hypothetical protein
MFGSFFTIKYIPPFTNLPKWYPLPVFKDLQATWLISKSETPRGILGTLPKMRHQKCAFCVLFTRFLRVLPVHHACSLAVYTFQFFFMPSDHVLLPPKKVTSRSRTFYLVPPLVFLSYLVPSHLLINVPNWNHQRSAPDASILCHCVPSDPSPSTCT